MMALDIARIREQRPGQPIHYFASIDTTMREAIKRAEGGAPGGTVVIADEQTAGQGRLGRTWHSEPGSGIYLSTVLRLPILPANLPIVTLMLGLATAEAIQKACSVACDLRWPNDVLIAQKKVAGILAQVAGECVIAGIGINVNQTAFPPPLRTPATSIRLQCGGLEQRREPLIVALLETLDAFTDLLLSQGAGAIRRAFAAASSYANHRRVVIEETGQRGTTAGIDESGFLLVNLDSGRLERLAAGGIRPEHSAA